jgi:hypothetical protein
MDNLLGSNYFSINLLFMSIWFEIDWIVSDNDYSSYLLKAKLQHAVPFAFNCPLLGPCYVCKVLSQIFIFYIRELVDHLLVLGLAEKQGSGVKIIKLFFFVADSEGKYCLSLASPFDMA